MKNKDIIMLLKDYATTVAKTNKYGDDIRIVQFGLFGEVGSIMAAVKKSHREGKTFVDYYDDAKIEEFGDSLWYFAAVCNCLGHDLDEIFSQVITGANYTHSLATGNSPTIPIARTYKSSVNSRLLELGESTANILCCSKKSPHEETKKILCNFAGIYLRSIQVANINFSEIVNRNIEKVHGRFLETDISKLPIFDKNFSAEESLPEKFKIKITQRKSGKTYLQWNGVFIGDPLTDNRHGDDGYRFHDVFHMAHAAILHWSPTFRSLIKHKRKSKKMYDEVEDGGRAIVIEEGLTAWIFSRAKNLDHFSHTKSISFDILKTIQQFVQGYEVERCPLKQWEKAILRGYKIFRLVQKNGGGVIRGNLQKRTITYRKNN